MPKSLKKRQPNLAPAPVEKLYRLVLASPVRHPLLSRADVRDTLEDALRRILGFFEIELRELSVQEDGIGALIATSRVIRLTTIEKRVRSRLDRWLRQAVPALGPRRLWIGGTLTEVSSDAKPARGPSV